MASSVAALSKTLESITLTKIRELEKQRSKYESLKNEVLQNASQGTDQRTRITQLLKGVEDLYPGAAEENVVRNIQHWLSQSKYDVCVPDHLLQSYEETLRSKLEVQSRKLGLGHLYARLVTEWMSASASDTPPSSSALDTEAFEVVDRQKERLQELCDKFERVVFEPLETDEHEIERYLLELFQGRKGDKGAKKLEDLRYITGQSCRTMFGNKSPFVEGTLKWCIDGLLAEDLLSDEKQQILREFLDNSMVLREMADILNMRFADIENWDWDAGADGSKSHPRNSLETVQASHTRIQLLTSFPIIVPVLPRQQLNGKYRIWMDEDILQAILIHYVGVMCCVNLKGALRNFIGDGIWKWTSGPQPSPEEDDRFQYFTQSGRERRETLVEERKERYRTHFFVSQLPETVRSIGFGQYGRDDRLEDGGESGRKTQNVKQLMLQTVASEALLRKSLDGEVAMIQTDLEWFATGLSHTTIFAIMRFFGYTEPVIAFYKKVLEAPLNVQSSPDSPPSSQGPRIRRRGVPMAHAPEKLIGELVLFAMDLVANQPDGVLLYRLHDDIWMCDKPEHCARAWTAMSEFATVMGLSFNKQKTGSVYLTDEKTSRDDKIARLLPQGEVKVGHLRLDPVSTQWEIDQPQVEEHVKQLHKQLDGCKSVLQWVQTWNSCIGRFFSHTFGEPAFCFGIDHVEKILETYHWMQESLFAKEDDKPGNRGGVVEHIKGMIRERFEVTSVPDAFIYLPESFGGLGLRNPFIPLLEVRELLQAHPPEKILHQLDVRVRGDYARSKARFESTSHEKRLEYLNKISEWASYDAKSILKILKADEMDAFFSFDEYTRYKESTSRRLRDTYRELYGVPYTQGPAIDDDVSEALSAVIQSPEDPKAREAMWALQMYSDSLRRDFGGMRLVDEQHLPLGVLMAMRSKAVKWTMVL